MFRKKTRPLAEASPTLTNDAYGRWLRAQRPPLPWFLALSEPEQEQLAMIGDEHIVDVIHAVVTAAKHPDAIEAVAPAAEPESEAAAIAQLVAASLAKRGEARSAAPSSPKTRRPTTMSKIGREPTEAKRAPRKLFGVESKT